MFLNYFHIQFSSMFGALALAATVFCTTEWFGDLRARMNPPKSPPFYDIIYDEPDCPFGLESVAIPEFVYFGEMIASKFVREHSQCLQFCLETTKCKAVNFFESMERKNPEVGFCELLVEGQYDNPRLMRPFKRATYHEKIHCRVENEEEKQPFIFDNNEGKELLIGNETNTTKIGKAEKEHEGEEEKEARKTIAEQQDEKRLDDQRSQKTTERQQQQRDDENEGKDNGAGKTETTPTTEEQTAKRSKTQEKSAQSHTTASLNSLVLKRLAERIRELKERFRN